MDREREIQIPIIDVSPLLKDASDRHRVTSEIKRACRESGFFYIIGHGVDEKLQDDLQRLSHQFFAQDLQAKLEIDMARGSRAWRGYFPAGRELTAGIPDLKEGI